MNYKELKELIEKNFDCYVESLESMRSTSNDFQINLCIKKNNCYMQMLLFFEEPCDLIFELAKILKKEGE